MPILLAGRPLFFAFAIILLSTTTPLVTAAAAMSVNARLAGQRVLVTGGGRGIGRAIALICSQEGAKVAVSSRTRLELEETAAMASGKIDIYEADVTKKEPVETMVQSIVKKWGGIDILVNNAGGAQHIKGPSETLDSDDLGRLLNLNVVSVHIVTSAVLRHAMQEGGGRIVNISSRAGKVGLPNYSFYVASKFALEGLTASMAEELRDRNIHVNSFSPGMVNTKSFPKPPDKKGVRTAESVRDGFLAILESGLTGHYLHADELDEAREKGLQDSAALKPIREQEFSPEITR